MMRGRDLVLESMAGYWDGYECVKVILPNIVGQRYVLGTSYPGERQGEEFIFTFVTTGLLGPTHGAIISVDDQGQYWIQNDTKKTTGGSFYNTFVNEERVGALEIRRLKSGDTVSVEDPETTRPGGDGFPVFCVKERTFGGSHLQSGCDNEASNTVTFAESPLVNNLILSEIMSYLPLKDLKNARLVCKKWSEEASKPLEKKGSIAFTFSATEYENPETSTKVFRYLHEMQDLKLRNIDITLCIGSKQNTLLPGQPGPKMLDDLRKLLKSSHNFSSLFLQAVIEKETGHLPFFLILQELGENLVELKLDIYDMSSPTALPSLPVMNRLKKFTVECLREAEPRWASLLVPLFSNNLEHFTCDGDTAGPYLQEFVKHLMPKLKGIVLQDVAGAWHFSTLLKLKTPLTFLEIHYSKWPSTPEDLLESLLLKHSKSLKTLVIGIEKGYYCCNKKTEIKFPSFPKLKELEVKYGPRTRISWESGLSYNDHFPSLRKLTVRPLEQWSENDPVFNAFFPDDHEGNLRCQTVEEVWIPVLPNPMRPCFWHYEPDLASFQPRMGQIRNMFPTAWNINFLQ